MKTTSLLRTVVLGGGLALLANPSWAGGGGAHSYDRNQAGQQRLDDSGTRVSNLEKEKKKDIEQALEDKGFEPGSVDGVIDSKTQSAISQFQRDNNLPATGTVDEQTAKQLGVDMMPSSSQGQSERNGSHSSSEGSTSSSRVR